MISQVFAKLKLSGKFTVIAVPEASKAANQVAEIADPDSLVSTLLAQYTEFTGSNSNADTGEADNCNVKTEQYQYMYVNNDRSFVVRNNEGQIVKTADVLRRIKEFKIDESGNLLVKKFGVWSEAKAGRLLENGTFIWRNADGETHECLDGTQIYISFSKKTLVAHNELSGEDISIKSKSEIRHLVKKDGVEIYKLYNDGKIVTEVETYSKPITRPVITIAGKQELQFVNRIEKTYRNNVLIKESFSFLDERTASRSVRMCLNLASGELHLSKVSGLDNLYRSEKLAETIYHLVDPVSISRDKEGNVSLIRGINKVRSFQLHDGICEVVFIDNNGDENVYFPTI